MMEALKAARGVLEREMAVRIDCFTLGGRIETTDDEGRALIAECADGMKAIDAVLADGWQPIATAPKDGTAILIYPAWGHYPNGERPGEAYWFTSPRCARWQIANLTIPCVPTHWRPLPPPPVGGV